MFVPVHHGPSLCAAESQTLEPTQSPIAYRRVFVPADNVEAWPRDGEKYIPVEARDFNAWVGAANEPESRRSSAATIDSAEYTAKLESDGRFLGRGQWNISLRGDKPAFLSLEHASLVIREPRWQNAAQQPVRLGVWGSTDSGPEHYGLEVPRSDILDFQWTTQTRSPHDEIEIPWRLPMATSTRVILDLPGDMQPRIDGGVVLESNPLAPDAAADAKPRRRWVLAVSPSLDSTLRIATTSRQAAPSVDQLTLREQTSYQVEQSGLQITAIWRLEGAVNRERELSMPLPRGSQLVSVAAEGHELSWQVARSAAPASDTAIIAMPNVGDQRSLQVVLTAWQPLVVDRSWQLPILRPEGVFWSSGKLELSIAAPFELRSLNPLDGMQNGVSQIGADATGPETYSLLMYSPTAALEVSIARRQPEVSIRAGSSLVLADPDVTGRLVTEWNVARSSVHRLSGELAAGWNVETVETIPADAMAEWFIDRRGNRRHIEIQLTDAASPARKVTVMIMGRLQRFSLAAPIAADTLRMVNWSGARVARHLLTFQSTEPFAVESVGELPLLAPDSVADADRSLLDAADDDNRIVDLAHAGTDAGLQLTFKRGQYATDVELEATFVKDELRQVYRITARPKANPVDRLLVYSTAPLGENVRWTEKSTGSSIVAERLPADDPQRKNLPMEGELWLLRLPQPTAGAIEVGASVTTAWPKRASVPLLALPEAIEQHGHAIVRSNNGGTPAVEPVGLLPIPLPLGELGTDRADDGSPVRVAYRFDPTDCLDASRTPRLWIGPGAESGTSPLVARHLDLESFFWPDGRGTHRATYQLEYYGAAEFKPALPLDAQLSAVSVNGQSLEAVVPGNGSQPLPIRLPSQSRSATVSIYFETRQASLSAGRTVSPPLLQNGIPLLAGEWTIWLPDEYAAKVAHQPADAEFNWRQRLFGPLARPSGSSTFHPLRPADWAHLVNGIADWRNASPPDVPRPDPAAASATTTTATAASPIRSGANDLTSTLDNLTKQGRLPSPLPGWQAYHETFVADGAPDPVVILHPAAITAWAVAVFLACFLWARRLCRDRGMSVVSLIAIAASLALLLPAAFAPLATGAMWGLLCSTLTEWPRRPLTQDDAPTVRNKQIAVAGVLTVAIAIGFTKLALAQSPEAQSPAPTTSSATPIQRVLIPIDSDRHPSGTKYYLSERFLRELLGSAAKQGPIESQWLLREAAYTGELTENRGRADIAAGTWALAFSIETLARDTTIVLPLVRDEATWQPTAMLDGVPVPLNWRDKGRKCAIEIAQPGRYTLTLYCIPKTENSDGRSQVNLTIPSLLSASIQLHAPELLTGIRVSNATLAPPAKDAPGILSGEIALADHLTVRWPRLEAKSSTSQGLTVTEMSWLHVGKEETDLETKYVVEGGARRPETLTITYDDRWQLLTKVDSPTDGRPRDESARPRSIQIPLPAADIDRQEVSLRWKLTDAPLPGYFRLPPVELASIPTTQRWFALSTDPSLECTVLDNAAPDATAKEFLAKWGSPAAATPQVVLSNSDPNRAWTFAVRPREAESVVHEVLHVAAGSQALRVVYQANVTPGNQHRFQYHLTVPANLSVDEIALTEADRQIPTRWIRDSENRVNIFFGEEATTEYRLTLSGSLPIDTNEKTALPRVTTSSLASATQQVQLYRDDDVHVDLQGLPPAEESNAGPNDLPPVQWLVRPLGVYHLDETAASAARIVIKPSQPNTTGDTLTTLTRESGTWSATFRCRLVAEKGDLDVLRLRIPATWAGPFEVDSSAPVVTDTTQLDEHSQILAIRFATTVAQGGQVDLQIRSPLMMPAGSPASVPEISLTSLSGGHRYLLVPASLDSQPIAWNEVGVREANVSRNLLPASANIAKQRQLEVIKDPFDVAVRSQATPQPAPRIRLADTSISAGDRGGQLIVTRLIVASDGLPECTLQLPSNQELVSVTLDGRPALTRALNASHWQVALGAAQLPQSLEIVSRSTADKPNDRRRELCRPILLAGDKPIPVEVSLWSFAHSLEAARTQIEGAASVSALDQAALRFDRLVSIAEAATAAATEAPRPDGENWFRPWAALLNSVQDQTRRIMAQPATEPAIAQVSRSSEEQINRASKRLDQWLQQSSELIAEPDASQPRKSSTATDLLISWLPLLDDQDSTCYVAEGGADRLVLKVVASSASPAQIQLLGLLVIVGLTAASAWLIRSPAAADFLRRWPQAFGILLGIAYWAWLWPSWVGLLIIAASLWFALRFDWPGRSLRPEGSTVLRSTRSH